MNEALARSILDDGVESISYPSLREATRTWLRVALLSFGGPAGQIAVMHRIIVEEKRWFLHALNYCMLLPGPEAQQLATYIGWLMHRTLGGLLAGGLFILPGIICIMVLSYVYALWGQVPAVTALFFGLKAAVLAIVIEAVIRNWQACAEKPLSYGSHRRCVCWHFLLRGSVPVDHPRCRTPRANRRGSYRSTFT